MAKTTREKAEEAIRQKKAKTLSERETGSTTREKVEKAVGPIKPTKPKAVENIQKVSSSSPFTRTDEQKKAFEDAAKKESIPKRQRSDKNPSFVDKRTGERIFKFDPSTGAVNPKFATGAVRETQDERNFEETKQDVKKEVQTQPAKTGTDTSEVDRLNKNLADEIDKRRKAEAEIKSVGQQAAEGIKAVGEQQKKFLEDFKKEFGDKFNEVEDVLTQSGIDTQEQELPREFTHQAQALMGAIDDPELRRDVLQRLSDKLLGTGEAEPPTTLPEPVEGAQKQKKEEKQEEMIPTSGAVTEVVTDQQNKINQEVTPDGIGNPLDFQLNSVSEFFESVDTNSAGVMSQAIAQAMVSAPEEFLAIGKGELELKRYMEQNKNTQNRLLETKREIEGIFKEQKSLYEQQFLDVRGDLRKREEFLKEQNEDFIKETEEKKKRTVDDINRRRKKAEAMAKAQVAIGAMPGGTAMVNRIATLNAKYSELELDANIQFDRQITNLQNKQNELLLGFGEAYTELDSSFQQNMLDAETKYVSDINQIQNNQTLLDNEKIQKQSEVESSFFDTLKVAVSTGRAQLDAKAKATQDKINAIQKEKMSFYGGRFAETPDGEIIPARDENGNLLKTWDQMERELGISSLSYPKKGESLDAWALQNRSDALRKLQTGLITPEQFVNFENEIDSAKRDLKREWAQDEYDKNTPDSVKEFTFRMGLSEDDQARFDQDRGIEPNIFANVGEWKNTIGNGNVTSGPDGSALWKWGLDIDGSIGDPISTPVSGEVIAAQENGGFGNQVKVKDKKGNQHWFSHLKDMVVKVGDFLSGGMVLGTMGNTGSIIPGPGGDGSHLDYTIQKPDGSYYTTTEVENFEIPDQDNEFSPMARMYNSLQTDSQKDSMMQQAISAGVHEPFLKEIQRQSDADALPGSVTDNVTAVRMMLPTKFGDSDKDVQIIEETLARHPDSTIGDIAGRVILGTSYNKLDQGQKNVLRFTMENQTRKEQTQGAAFQVERGNLIGAVNQTEQSQLELVDGGFNMLSSERVLKDIGLALQYIDQIPEDIGKAQGWFSKSKITLGISAEEAQRLDSLLTWIKAPIRNEIAGTAVTEYESKFLDPIMPEIQEGEVNMTAAIQELGSAYLRAYNTARQLRGLLMVDYDGISNPLQKTEMYEAGVTLQDQLQVSQILSENGFAVSNDNILNFIRQNAGAI